MQTITTLLLDSEARVQTTKVEVPILANMVTHQASNTVTDNGSTPSYRPTSTFTRGRGRGRMPGSRIQCQLYGKMGHFVDRCYHRFDASYKSPNFRPPQASVCMFGNNTSMPTKGPSFNTFMPSPMIPPYGNWMYAPSSAFTNNWLNPFCTMSQSSQTPSTP